MSRTFGVILAAFLVAALLGIYTGHLGNWGFVGRDRDAVHVDLEAAATLEREEAARQAAVQAAKREEERRAAEQHEEAERQANKQARTRPDDSPAQSNAPPASKPTAMPTPNPAYRALLAEAQQISPGRIAYNPPARMRIGVPETIQVRIARNDVERDITHRMIGRGMPASEPIEVGAFMRVRLDGRAAFDITSSTQQDLAIRPGGIGEWVFYVTPLEAGPQTLDLYVYIRVKVAGMDEMISQPALRREIAVEVNYWWDITALWRENWKWFLGGLGSVITAIGGYLLKRWWERRQGDAAG
jgi:hypothetical protein